MLPAEFGSNYTPAKMYFEDVMVAFLIVVVGVSLCLGVSGGPLQRLRGCLVLIIGWAIGGSIIGLQVSRDWERAEVQTNISMPAAEKPNALQDRPATLRLLIGLRGVNITFATVDEENNSFHFNEQFIWAWHQGREGFGPFAGSFQQDFRRGQRIGLPTPVLQVADLFIHDGEGIRWGRMYRISGWHVQSLLWTALASWIVSILCLQVALAPAAKMIGLTGMLLCCAATVWLGLSPSQATHYPSVIMGDVILTPKLGPAFYVCLIAGLVCLTIAAFLLICDARFPLAAATLFGLDPLISYDEHYCSADQMEDNGNPVLLVPPFTPQLPRSSQVGAYEPLEMDVSSGSMSNIDVPCAPNESRRQTSQILVLRRRGTSFFSSPSRVVLQRRITKNEDPEEGSSTSNNSSKNDRTSRVDTLLSQDVLLQETSRQHSA